jgi:hypothetical protein
VAGLSVWMVVLLMDVVAFCKEGSIDFILDVLAISSMMSLTRNWIEQLDRF